MVRQMLKVYAVVLGISLICSLLVTSAVILLKDRQRQNERAHKIGHVLALADITVEADMDPAQIYRDRIEPLLVDLQTGHPADAGQLGMADLIAYDLERMARHPEYAVSIPHDLDLARIKRRPRYLPVYFSKDETGFSHLILPIYGMGLWSTLYGYLALKPDLITIAGIGFYQHKETPGLGGEVDNPRWKALWQDKRAFDGQGRLAIRVIKGAVDLQLPEAVHRVDGLTGATFTTQSVDHLVRYWLGPHGYGPFLDRLRAGNHTSL